MAVEEDDLMKKGSKLLCRDLTRPRPFRLKKMT